jgi:hypothetical protein
MVLIMVFAVKDLSTDLIPSKGVINMDSLDSTVRGKLYEEAKVLASKTALKLVISIIDRQSLLSNEQLLKLKEYGIEYQILK